MRSWIETVDFFFRHVFDDFEVFDFLGRSRFSIYPPVVFHRSLALLGHSWGDLGASWGDLGVSWADLGVVPGGPGGRARIARGPMRETHSRAEIARHPQEKQFYQKKHFYNSTTLMQKLQSHFGNSALGVEFRAGGKKHIMILAPL